MGNLPGALIGEAGRLTYYRCDSAQPGLANEWIKMIVASSGHDQQLGMVGGTPFATYLDNTNNLHFARTLTIRPTTTSDWHSGLITNGPVTLSRLIDYNGRPAVVFVSYQGKPEDRDATVWFALAKTTAPSAAQDWTLTALDYSGSMDTPGLVLMGTDIYVSFNVNDSGLRPSGQFLMRVGAPS